MTIDNVLATEDIEVDWGNAVANAINGRTPTVHTDSTNVAGIGTTEVTLTAVSETVSFEVGANYLVDLWIPIRWGAAATAFTYSRVRANGTVILVDTSYTVFTGNQRQVLWGRGVWNATHASRDITLSLETSTGSCQTHDVAEYGYMFTPLFVPTG